MYFVLHEPIAVHRQVGHGRGNFLRKDNSFDSTMLSTSNYLSMPERMIVIGYTNFGLYRPLHLDATHGLSIQESASMLMLFSLGEYV